MKRLALLLPLLALAAGCSRDNGASIQIQGICGPTTACQFTGKCDSYVVINPAMDSGATDFLMLFFEIENQLPDNSKPETGRLDTNGASIDEAVVEYGGLLSGSRSFPLSERVKSAGSSVFGLEVIPPALGERLPNSPPVYPLVGVVTATIKLKGRLDDGSRFETAEFPFAVNVTRGAAATFLATCAGACPQTGQYPAGCP